MSQIPCDACLQIENQSAETEPHAHLTSGPTAAIWGGQDLESVGRWWKCSVCGTVMLRNIDSRMGERLWHFADSRFNGT